MDNKLNTTVNCLSLLINTLNDSRNFYYRLLNLNVDYKDFIEPLYNQKVDFLNKLLKEYKRLTKKEYPLDYSLSNNVITLSNIDLLEECIKNERQLIDLYTDTINKDVLWEVLPVLAKHINYLRASRGLLLNYISEYKEQNRSIQIDYSNHPSMVNWH